MKSGIRAWARSALIASLTDRRHLALVVLVGELSAKTFEYMSDLPIEGRLVHHLSFPHHARSARSREVFLT